MAHAPGFLFLVLPQSMHDRCMLSISIVCTCMYMAHICIHGANIYDSFSSFFSM